MELLNVLIPGTYLAQVSVQPPIYRCSCGNTVHFAELGKRTTCGTGCPNHVKKRVNVYHQLHHPIPGSYFIPIGYDPPEWLCQACGNTYTHFSRWKIDNLHIKHCGCLKRNAFNPIGVPIEGSKLVPVDYDTDPPTYICCCGRSVQRKKYHVDKLLITHCGCQRNKRQYWTSTCPHCTYVRFHIGPHRDKVTCGNYECRMSYIPQPEPCTCTDYMNYLRRRRA